VERGKRGGYRTGRTGGIRLFLGGVQQKEKWRGVVVLKKVRLFECKRLGCRRGDKIRGVSPLDSKEIVIRLFFSENFRQGRPGGLSGLVPQSLKIGWAYGR